jgi:hypothetical protein
MLAGGKRERETKGRKLPFWRERERSRGFESHEASFLYLLKASKQVFLMCFHQISLEQENYRVP